MELCAWNLPRSAEATDLVRVAGGILTGVAFVDTISRVGEP